MRDCDGGESVRARAYVNNTHKTRESDIMQRIDLSLPRLICTFSNSGAKPRVFIFLYKIMPYKARFTTCLLNNISSLYYLL